MFKYLCRRLLYFIPVSIVVVTLVSLMTHIIPGDPVDILLGEYASYEQVLELRHTLGLDQPLWKQWYQYISSLATGNLGKSLIYEEDVAKLIGQRWQASFELAILAVIFCLIVSLILGSISALRAGSWLDNTCMGLAALGVSLPNFWLGPMLILVFSVGLGLFPISERGGPLSYVLPVITLGSALSSVLSRVVRNALLAEFKQHYVRTAKSKGLDILTVLFVHVYKNSALPVISVLGLQLGVLLTGALITEKIFDWPGLGTLILEALGQRDYPLIQGCVLVFSFTYLLINLLTDLIYAYVDPRIKISGDS